MSCPNCTCTCPTTVEVTAPTVTIDPSLIPEVSPTLAYRLLNRHYGFDA